MVTAPERRQEMVGYVLIALVVLGLLYLVYWLVIAEQGKNRSYKNIEKIRSELILPPHKGQLQRSGFWYSRMADRPAEPANSA